jgi:hypothetical protein
VRWGKPEPAEPEDASFKGGTVVISVTGVQQPLTSHSGKDQAGHWKTVRSITVRADSGNSAAIKIGPSQNSAFPLYKTDAAPTKIDVVDLTTVWVSGTAADKLYWLAGG